MQLTKMDNAQVRQLGKDILKQYRDDCTSFADAAQRITEHLYQTFQSPEGEPEFALIRIFRTTSFSQLPPELRASVPSDTGQYLTLMGTYGLEEEWRDRSKSKTRQAIHISNDMSPMFQGVFQELGFDWIGAQEIEFTSDTVASMSMVRSFHVPDVSVSNYITDQEEFVQAYHIKSVMAAGTRFITGEGFVLIGFTLKPINDAQIEQLSEMLPHLSTLLAIFETRAKIWD
ncbi:MAG: hypothetical protein ACFE0Q_11000 [Anaerolineae bacterium]